MKVLQFYDDYEISPYWETSSVRLDQLTPDQRYWARMFTVGVFSYRTTVSRQYYKSVPVWWRVKED